MRKWISAIISVLLLSTGLVFLASSSSTADDGRSESIGKNLDESSVSISLAQNRRGSTADGCSSLKIKKKESWNKFVNIPTIGDENHHTLNLSGEPVYTYCPTDTYEFRKVKFNQWITFCWSFYNGRQVALSGDFDGVTFDVSFWNLNDKIYNPSPFKVTDNNNIQHCDVLDLKSTEWWFVTSGPKWSLQVKINLVNNTDPLYNFYWYDSLGHNINPTADDSIGGWFD